jgi:hypothetical protein
MCARKVLHAFIIGSLVAFCAANIASRATAQTIQIVAFGGSSTFGQFVERSDTYPPSSNARYGTKVSTHASSTPGSMGTRPPMA